MEGKNLLLVEGSDDVHVVGNLLTAHGSERLFEAKAIDGIANLFNTFRVSLETELRCVGVMVDADDSAADRWQSLRGILTKSGYTGVPQSPSIGGTIIRQPGLLPVGVWIMPDNLNTGMLEDFAASLADPNDPLLPLATETVSRIPAEHRKFGNKQAKAIIHTWLAWQDEPGRPLGVAIKFKYLNANAQSAQPFISWLKSLAASAIEPE